MNPIDYVGKRFGRWVILAARPANRVGNRPMLCRCDCGVEKLVTWGNLSNGLSTQCVQCGNANATKTRHETYVKRYKKRGIEFLGNDKISCPGCGNPRFISQSQCRNCAEINGTGMPRKGHPVALQIVADAAGISRQAVQQIMAFWGGWNSGLDRLCKNGRITPKQVIEFSAT